jgi:hypothetical protein
MADALAPTRIRPHPGQAKVLKATQPTVAAIASTGGGKTVTGMIWLILSMARGTNALWLVVEPTWNLVDRVLRRAPGALRPPRQLQQGRPGQLPHPGHHLPGQRHPPGIHGGRPRGRGLAGPSGSDEPHLTYETVNRRASFLSGQLLLTSTPYNRGWLYQEVYQRWQAGDPDFFVSQFPSTANPRYPREVVGRNRRSMNWPGSG